MKKYLLILLAAMAFEACEKEDFSPQTEQPKDPLADVIRIAQEGAAMLEDATTRTSVARRIDRGRISCKVKPATRAGESDDTLYYVVNYADNAGFAIVSADEQAPDGARLIAVTESGNYTAGETTDNAGFNMYMDMVETYGHGELIDTSILRPTPTPLPQTYTEDYYSDWTTVGPYVQVKWGQGSQPYDSNYPYNKYFLTPGNVLCPAGCTTVAIAQIMSYYRMPDHYTVTYDGSGVRKTLDWDVICANIGGVGYVWNTEMADMIALWFREIGKRASANLTYNVTWSTELGAREALSRFGYYQNEEIAYNFSIVKSELNVNRLVLMLSYSTIASNGVPANGHAWVIDGYKTRTHYYKEYTLNLDGSRNYTTETTTTYNYLHFNWGYDGQSNGYFASGVYNLMSAYEFDDPEYLYEGNYPYSPVIITDIRHQGNDHEY